MYIMYYVVIAMISVNEIGAQIVLQGTNKVKDLVGQLNLICTFETLNPSKNSVQQLIIYGGDKKVAVLSDGTNVDIILDTEWVVRAAGSLNYAPGKSYLNVTIENLTNGTNAPYTCIATEIDQNGKFKNYTSPAFLVTIVRPRPKELRAYLVAQIRTFQQQLKNLKIIVKALSQEDVRIVQDQDSLTKMRESVVEALSKEFKKTLEDVRSRMVEKKEVADLKSSMVSKEEMEALKTGIADDLEKRSQNWTAAARSDVENLKSTLVEKNELLSLKSTLAEKSEFDKLKTIMAQEKDVEDLKLLLADRQQLNTLKSKLAEREEVADLKQTKVQKYDLDKLKSTMADKKELDRFKSTMAEKQELFELQKTLVARKDLNILKSSMVEKKELDKLKDIMVERKELDILKAPLAEKKDLESMKSKMESQENELNILKSKFLEKTELDNVRKTMVDKKELASLKSSMASIKEVHSLYSSLYDQISKSRQEMNELSIRDFDKAKVRFVEKAVVEKLGGSLREYITKDIILSEVFIEFNKKFTGQESRLTDFLKKQDFMKQGSVDCWKNLTWKILTKTPFQEEDVDFTAPPFSNLPRVVVGLRSFDIQGPKIDFGSFYRVAWTTGFQAICDVWYNDVSNFVTFDWLAYKLNSHDLKTKQ